MAHITAIFSDVGGVLGTNGWDRSTRQRAVEHFRLNWAEFEDRHELMFNALETGQLRLDEYLDRTIFYRHRDFSREQFRDFMFEQSMPFPESVALFRRVAQSRRYFLAILNNESLDLNLYRIQRFGLREIFSIFLSSCFLGVRKPQDAIFRLALTLTQRQPEECLFIDDRLLNVERARQCGMQVIHCQNPGKLEQQVRDAGIEL